MQLTIKELKEKIANMNDDDTVYIERIEDVYFEKHNWKTQEVVYQRDSNGNIIDSTKFFEASFANKVDNKLIICGHI